MNAMKLDAFVLQCFIRRVNVGDKSISCHMYSTTLSYVFLSSFSCYQEQNQGELSVKEEIFFFYFHHRIFREEIKKTIYFRRFFFWGGGGGGGGANKKLYFPACFGGGRENKLNLIFDTIFRSKNRKLLFSRPFFREEKMKNHFLGETSKLHLTGIEVPATQSRAGALQVETY